MRTTLEMLSYDKHNVWLRVGDPRVFNAHVILTMPRETLKHGMATAQFISAEVDPESLSFGGDHSGFRADVELIEVVEWKENPDSTEVAAS